MTQEARKDYPSLWSAIESIAPKVGCTPQTLNEWVRKYEVDSGTRDGVTTAEKERVKALEREVKELRQSNEILRLASAFLSSLKLASSFSPRRNSTASKRNEALHRRTSPYFWGRVNLQGISDCPVWVLETCRLST